MDVGKFCEQPAIPAQHSRSKRLSFLAVCWIALPVAALAQAQAPGTSVRADTKVQSQLLDLEQHPDIALARGGHQTEVDVVADVTPEVLARIKELGGTVISQFPAEHAIRAKLSLTALRSLAAHPNVKFIGPAAQPIRNQGTPGGTPGLVEGDIAHKADVARATYRVDGSGVKVCVISDSIDNPQGVFAAAVAS